MNEIESAIKQLEAAFQTSLTRLAIQALREKQERQAGCKHCIGTDKCDCEDWTIFGNEAATIKYCPMCGRKLTMEAQ